MVTLISSARRFWLFACLSAGLLACAGTTPPDTRPWSVRMAERLERTLSPERVALAPQQAQGDLERALQYYDLADDQAGQARCHLKLARLHLQLGTAEQAPPHLAEADRIAARLGDTPMRYESALLTARLSGRPEDYERALSFAAMPVERATVLTYLGRIDEAYAAIRPHLGEAEEAADDFAFVLYRYAERTRDQAAAHQALSLYKQVDNHAGVAATLHLLGLIALEQGQPDQARGYLERALTVSRALGDEAHSRRIETALERL